MDGLKAAYCYWPFALAGLYTLVPLRYGNLYFDSLNLVWAVALSYFANREKVTTIEKKALSTTEKVKKMVSKTAPSSPRSPRRPQLPSTITLHS